MRSGVKAAMDTDCERKLAIYATLLLKWQKKINLVGSSTIGDLRARHFDDSLQLLPLAGAWRNWLDLGSGAGFPGMVIAIAAGNHERKVHLVESDKRKAAFLRDVSRETLSNVEIHADRIERVLPDLISTIQFDIISARALASLERLIFYARPILEKGGVGLFLKGKGLSSELTPAVTDGSVILDFIDSRTDIDAKIVVVRGYNSQTNTV
ncbi:16S rRNA (guanine(527)-N(7))-methyltransferase RsmG [uncultured Rhodoblastus sp.]|uniref:16S rRNA (guanine(527)-N(7))-methyltransferase RsmG n=1 Tax=uncultured Rhodoblastus sp. TaxID=543037 RepID=UPI0025D206D5|nr:16S rRNA (guanine(527)-N(7))-methyltransferase RsmG [uncultured Rhodoblastus sp.]